MPALKSPSDRARVPESSSSVVPAGSSAIVTLGNAAVDPNVGVGQTHISAPAATTAATTLRLVAGRTFVKFTFFKVDPAWRRRSPEERAADKAEFQAACEDFAEDRSLRAYSTVGTRGDTDLLLLSQSPILEDIHTFHVV